MTKTNTATLTTVFLIWGTFFKYSFLFIVSPMRFLLLGIPLFLLAQMTILQMGEAQAIPIFILWIVLCYTVGLVYTLIRNKKKPYLTK